MSTLFWPGDERAGSALTDAALLTAMLRVESAWLEALVSVGVAPAVAAADLDALVTATDVPLVAERAEGGGNPVIPFLALLRERLAAGSPEAARWVHRGLTSQDVLDTALVLCVRDVLMSTRRELLRQVDSVGALAERHRGTAMVARTLTQHAVPITFGAKAAGWLGGLLDAVDDLDRTVAELPAQFGGAAGTLSAATLLAVAAGLDEPASRALELAALAATSLGLAVRSAWHGSRAPITRLGSALAGCTAAFGRIANDVLTLSRPEIGELSEPTAPGRGGSSAMPQKVNPVLSVLIRRAALAAPSQATQLQLAAAEAHDERPAGSWHVEWQALQLLGRHTLTAASQTTELLAGLRVHADRMQANLAAAEPGVLAELRSILGDDAGLGDACDVGDRIVDAALTRAGSRAV